MDYRSVRWQRLWEAMESCQDDDLSDPQFADLVAELAENPELRVQFQRVRDIDTAIKAAFADVPVPADLGSRISRRLAGRAEAVGGESALQVPRLQAALNPIEPPAAAASSQTALPAVASVTESVASPRKAKARFSRRQLLLGFTGLSTAAALLIAVWFQTHQPRHDSPGSVLEQTLEFFGQDNQPPGELLTRVAPPVEYPLSRDIVRLDNIRWRSVEKFLGGPAVAYDLPPRGGRATLYVAQRNVPGLPSLPPPAPTLSTGGKSVAAWQVGDTLFVLVVEGESGMYSSYLDQSRPLT